MPTLDPNSVLTTSTTLFFVSTMFKSAPGTTLTDKDIWTFSSVTDAIDAAIDLARMMDNAPDTERAQRQITGRPLMVKELDPGSVWTAPEMDTYTSIGLHKVMLWAAVSQPGETLAQFFNRATCADEPLPWEAIADTVRSQTAFDWEWTPTPAEVN